MAGLRDVDPDRTRVNGKPLEECSREELADAVRMLVRHVVDLELRAHAPPPGLAGGGLAGIIGGPGGVSWALTHPADGPVAGSGGSGGNAGGAYASPIGSWEDAAVVAAGGTGGPR